MTINNTALASPYHATRNNPEADERLLVLTQHVARRWNEIDPEIGSAMIAATTMVMERLRNELTIKRTALQTYVRDISDTASQGKPLTTEQIAHLFYICEESQHEIMNAQACLDKMNDLFNV